MILTAWHLKRSGFDFWDLGMPLDYKYTLGARDIGIREFVKIFRAARRPL
jgi:leucyl/phenylalanyl-tRNA--protein transferase